MKISLAQIKPVKGDIEANLLIHKNYIRQAAQAGADCIFFPELSITSYESALAEQLVMKEGDNTLDELQELSNQLSITIGIGMPIVGREKPRIGMGIFQPFQSRQCYFKQQLHSDEFPFFEAGEKQVLITVKDTQIAPAICYESLQPDHSERAYQLGANLYLASVAKSQQGVDKAMAYFPSIARKYSMHVMMVNCIGACDDFEAAGQTAVWSKEGTLIVQLTNSQQGLVLCQLENEKTTTIFI
ncbi:MAG: carbon-nitrogen hydrolase family protein [Flavihumibacter sp.]|jgi:predicted amidohydrolase|nr:carbon-nitrogen hydrolase family protein [Flavihumibacter sp.]